LDLPLSRFLFGYVPMELAGFVMLLHLFIKLTLKMPLKARSPVFAFSAQLKALTDQPLSNFLSAI